MRLIFSLTGLLVLLAIVGFLAKSQLSAVTQLPNSTPSSANAAATPANPVNISEQSKQIQTQVKDQLNETMKAATEAREKALESGNADKPTEKAGSAY